VHNSRANVQLDYSASVLAVLQRFYCDISSFNGEKIHSLMNVITLEKNVRDVFDRFEFYLEATVSIIFLFFKLSHSLRYPCDLSL
jgi:HNH endonuclease